MYGGAAFLLLAAVGGYWVIERAASHRGRLKQVGQLLGTIIIVVSLIGVVCRVWCLATGNYSCGIKAKGWHHMQSMKTMPVPSE